jgi:hypothetical protein
MTPFSAEVRALLPDFAFAELGDTAQEVEALRITVFSANEVSPVAKIPYKAREILQAVLRRGLELFESFVRDCNDKAFVPLFVTGRALMESAALAADLWLRIDVIIRGWSKTALTELDEILMRALLGSRSADWGDPEKYLAHNVLTLVDRVGKALDIPLRSTYDGLSEHAHPNSSGTLLAYCRQNVSDRHSTFVDRPFATLLDGVDSVVSSTGLSLTVLALAVRDFEKHLPEFVALCEEAIHDGGTWPSDTPFPRGK